MAWTYYVYVIAMCIFTSKVLAEKTVFLVIYHPLLMLSLWAYFMSVSTKPRNPPQEFHLEENEWVMLNQLPQWTLKNEMDNLRLKMGIKTTKSMFAGGTVMFSAHAQDVSFID